jgi:hypothetical protein
MLFSEGGRDWVSKAPLVAAFAAAVGSSEGPWCDLSSWMTDSAMQSSRWDLTSPMTSNLGTRKAPSSTVTKSAKHPHERSSVMSVKYEGRDIGRFHIWG